MIRSILFSIATAALAISAPLLTMSAVPESVLAQTHVSSPSAEEAFTGNECLSVYPFGKLTMNLQEPAEGAAVSPGDVIAIAGTISNDSHASLPDGKVYVRILRDDAAVAEQQWHPVVAEFTVNHISVPAYRESAGTAAFTTSWHVPAFAPAGAYRVELSYVAADGSPIIGVPYVPNVFGVTSAFTVREAGQASAVSFDRSGVVFNNAPFVFRAVPPRPDAGPLSISAPLKAASGTDISVDVETSLYRWTDVEGDTLVSSKTEPYLLSATDSTPISFSWEAPEPGVYELVLKATPLSEAILPSILHVRFYYEGTVPRILHAGMREEADGSGTVAACFFNSTFGPEGGSGSVKIELEGTTVQEINLPNLATEKLRLFPISKDVRDAGFVLVAEAKDLTGAVTDTERIQFPGEQKPEGSLLKTWLHIVTIPTWWYLTGGTVVIVLLLGLYTYSRRHRMYTEPKEPPSTT